MKKKTSKLSRQFDIKIDKSLDKYNDVPMFQKKLDEANETLKRVGLPKDMKKFK